MDFKKPSSKSVKPAIAIVGGGIAGAMVSRAAYGFIDKDVVVVGADAATIKKAENTAMLKRGALAVVGVLVAACTSGTDTAATAVQGAGAGMAIQQTLEIVKTLSARGGVTPPDATTPTAKKALANAVGLGCGCSSTAALNGRRKRSRLNAAYPTYENSNMDTYAEAQPANTFALPQAEPLASWG